MAKKKEIILSLLGFLILLGFSSVHAFEIRTQDFYIKFPTDWKCDQETNLFVCTENSSSRQKSGVIVFQFGNAGPLDTLDQFRTRLKAPRSIKGKGGLPLLSRVVSMQDKNINGQTWFEALHFEGELPDYYTYYVATRRGDLQFLMTLTAHTSRWSEYKPLFERTIGSLQLTNSAQPRASGNLGQGAPPPPMPQGGAPMPVASAPPTAMGTATPGLIGGFKKSTLILFGAVIAAALMILYALKAD